MQFFRQHSLSHMFHYVDSMLEVAYPLILLAQGPLQELMHRRSISAARGIRVPVTRMAEEEEEVQEEEVMIMMMMDMEDADEGHQEEAVSETIQ